ncbi:MAG: rhamnulokinase [Verrucomicrobia bacterium]|nr:rhamnulokinase [Verrucomicrobiota bacterium]
MRSPQVYLGVDLGAESGRVVAGLWDGSRMALEAVHRFPNRMIPVAGTLRWDVLGLWGEILAGLRMAGTRWGSQVVSVGVDTWGLDYGLVSRSGELLGLPFCYRDARTRGLVVETMGRIPRAEIFEATGLQFLEINTLYQWIAHQRASPEVFEAAAAFQMIPDWLHGCLSGVCACEFTNATTTQFLNPRTRDWSHGLLRRLGLPTHLLPGLIFPGTRLGPLRPEVAAATGIHGASVVVPATHDTASAVAGTPGGMLGESGWAYISSGTWSLVGIESAEPLMSPAALALNVTNEGGVCGTWRVLKNVMGLWLLQRCRADWAARGQERDYASLMASAALSAPLRSLVDPDDLRFLNPEDMGEALVAACRESGQPEPDSESAIVRCILESLALKYAVVLDQLETLSGTPITAVHVVGGGSRNALLNQWTADASGRVVIAGPVEATAMGNLLVQVQGAGELGSLQEIRCVIRDSSELTEFRPNPATACAWADARGRMERS